MVRRSEYKDINWNGKISAALHALSLSLTLAFAMSPLAAAEATVAVEKTSLGQNKTAPPIKAFSQSFKLTSSGVPFSIKAERRLRVDADGNWHMKVSADNWLGEITEDTIFSWDECIPQSSYYGYKRVGLGKERRAEVHLNRGTGEARVVKAKKENVYPITTATTDKLSQTLALQCMLSRGDMALELDIADERGLDRIQYRREGEEWLKTPAGKIRAVKLERVRDTDSDRRTLLWFARDHDYSLVQMIQEEDGKQHTLVIRSLSH